ncbi:MAG TPA: nucleotide sugar dehydrogenase [Clostridia bacterium]
MREVCIIGLGYIGLPTAAMFATHGVKVRGVDVKKQICDKINEGLIHIEEPYLADLVKQAVLNGMISCSTETCSSDAFIIAVPTPITEDRKADLSYVENAGIEIAKVLKKGDLVILESTVSPRCTLDVLVPILERSGLKAGEDFYLAHCPERVLPGQIIYELENNNKIIGGINAESAEKAKDLYLNFVKGEIFLTDTVTAELCKLMENTFRDVNIALANELAKICERLGCNAWEVIKYANKHPRVNLHTPGPGVGGHCLAVDPWFIVEAMPEIAKIIELSRQINDSMPEFIHEKILGLVPEGSKVVVLGCTYKPDVDDIRESPVIHLVDLLKNKYDVEIVDPYVKEFNKNIYEVSNNADIIILGVHHKQFRNLNFEVLGKIMKRLILLDTRNYYDRAMVEKFGFKYYLIGNSH